MKRILSFLVALVVAVSAVFVGIVAVDAAPPEPVTVETLDAPLVSAAQQPVADLVPLTPSRILDTRDGRGVESAGRVGPGATIDLAVLGVGGVPGEGVAGVAFNLTATAATARTFVNAWPAGEVEPTTSVLNVQSGEVFANLVVAELGADGRVSLSNEFGDVHLLADVVGWIPTDSMLDTVTPARLLDTREGVGAAAGRVGAGGQVDLDVLGVGGVPESGVDSVLVNLTATAATERSFVTVWPTGELRPTASVLNMNDAAPVPNLVLAKVGDGGKISLFNGAGSTHLIADVVGYTTSGAVVVPLVPKRLLDTRSGVGVDAGRVGRGEFVDVGVVGVAGVPERGATAAIINVTAAAPSERSFVTTWPTGLPQPEASSLNMLAGENVANLVIAPIGAGGKVRLFNASGTTHLIADVVGYVGMPAGATVPTVADEVRVVAEEQLVAVDGDPDADDLVTVRLAADADVEVGSILVIGPTEETPTGLLRRIVSTETAADGSTVAVGERATISDAIPQGSFAVNTTFDATAATVSPQREGVASMVQGTSVQDHPFQCGAGVSGVSFSGDVDASADPSLSMHFDWDLSGVNSAQLTAGLDVALEFTASATASLGCSLMDSIFSVPLPYIYTIVAGVPVVFVPTFKVELGVSAALEGSISGSAQYRADVTAGVVYDKVAGLSTVGAVTPSMSGDWTVGAKAVAGLSLTPSISLLAYGLSGPKAAVTFGVGIEADPCRTPLWKATSSVTTSIALTVDVPWLTSVDLGKAEAILNQSELATGGTAIPNFPGCDFKVDVVRHVYHLRSTAGANRDEDSRGGSEYFSDSGRQTAEQFGPDASGDLLSTERNLVDGMVETVTVVEGPYRFSSWNAATSATATVGETNSSSDASLLGTVASTATMWSWQFTASGVLKARANSDGLVGSREHTHDSDADFDASADVTVELAAPATLTITPRCPTIDWSATGVSPSAGGCLDPVTLPAGQYRFSARFRAEADADDGGTDNETASGAIAFMLVEG